ncbi:MAG: aquaporin, partial [Pseudomonadota bacterium]
AQLVGGVAGAFALAHLIGVDSGLGVTVLAAGVSPAQGLILEVILTFILVTSVLNAAVSGKAGDLAGIAIGSTLIACILIGGPLTGASFNPARTLGPAVVTGNYADIWLYFVGPILGGVIAAVLYNAVLKE